MDKNIRGSDVVYQSLSYNMIFELRKNPNTPAWIKIWLYFSLMVKSGKDIWASNEYISEHLHIPLGTVKHAIKKLRDEELIEVVNSGSWKRQIKLTRVAIITDKENKELRQQNNFEYHSLSGRRKYLDNVYLSDSEYEELNTLLEDTKALDFYIEGLNAYLSEAVITYTSHYQMIYIWYQKNNVRVQQKKKKYSIPDYKWYRELERGYLNNKREASPDKTDIEDIFYFDWLGESSEE